MSASGLVDKTRVRTIPLRVFLFPLSRAHETGFAHLCVFVCAPLALINLSLDETPFASLNCSRRGSAAEPRGSISCTFVTTEKEREKVKRRYREERKGGRLERKTDRERGSSLARACAFG